MTGTQTPGGTQTPKDQTPGTLNPGISGNATGTPGVNQQQSNGTEGCLQPPKNGQSAMPDGRACP